MARSPRAISARRLTSPLLPAALAAALLLLGGAWQAAHAEPAGACVAAAAVSADAVSADAVSAEAAGATAPATMPAIRVTVDNVRNSKGLITAVLYSDDPDTFLKRGARLDRIRVEAQEGETGLCLPAPSSGRYSVALYHDENGNKEFDRDFLGIPTEGYGFSQNPGFRFGKPDVEETLFTIDGESTSLQVSILYLQG